MAKNITCKLTPKGPCKPRAEERRDWPDRLGWPRLPGPEEVEAIEREWRLRLAPKVAESEA